MWRLKQLETYDDVLDVLGASTIGRLCDQQANAPYTWRTARGKFPAKYYFVMKGALQDKGYWAPISLWGFHSKGDAFAGPKKKPRRKTTKVETNQAA